MTALLDVVVFVVMVVLYLGDRLVLRLLLRGMLQVMLVDPFPQGSAARLQRIHVSTTRLFMMWCVVWGTVVSVVWHALESVPGGESHGGVIVQIVGEELHGGWRSRLRLMVLDVVVGLLQAVSFCVSCVELCRKNGEPYSGRAVLYDIGLLECFRWVWDDIEEARRSTTQATQPWLRAQQA